MEIELISENLIEMVLENIVSVKKALEENISKLGGELREAINEESDTKSAAKSMIFERRKLNFLGNIEDYLEEFFEMEVKEIKELGNEQKEKVSIRLSRLISYFLLYGNKQKEADELTKIFESLGLVIKIKEDGLLDEEISKQEVAALIADFKDKIETEDKESNWTDTTSVNNDDDIMYIDDEEMQELDEEIFNENDDNTIYMKEGESVEHAMPDTSSQKFKFHEDYILSLSVNTQTNGIFAASSGDDTATIWDITKPEPLFHLKGHTDTVDRLRFNHDGSLLATSSLDATIRIWDSNTGELRKTLDGPSDEIRFIDWHSKGDAIVCGSADSSVWLFNARAGKVLNSFYGHEKPLMDGGFTPDGKLIVSVSEDATLRVWKPTSGECLHKVSGYNFHDAQINSVQFHKTKPIALTLSADRTACLVNYNTGKVLGKTPDHDDNVESGCFYEKQDAFYTASADSKIRCFDINKMSVKDLISVDAPVTKLMFYAESNLLLASTFGGSLYIVDPRQKSSLHHHMCGSCIHDFQLIPSEGKVMAGCEDGLIRSFDFKFMQ